MRHTIVTVVRFVGQDTPHGVYAGNSDDVMGQHFQNAKVIDFNCWEVDHPDYPEERVEVYADGMQVRP